MSTDGPGYGLPRRFLQPLLLLSLARGERSYGYELAEAVRAHGVKVDMAGVYRELRTMERHDLLSSAWEPSDAGPDRRIYELTAAGVQAAASAGDELRAARDLLSSAIEGAEAEVR